MKAIIMAILLCVPTLMLSGCCMDDICNIGDTYTSSKKCNSCSTCSTCGYDASYSYSGWY